MNSEQRAKCEKYRTHFSELLGVGCKIVNLPDGDTPAVLLPQASATNFCAHCSSCHNGELSTHLYGCNEAHRWNGKYIYYCPLGLLFIAASLMADNGELAGGMVLGPIVLGDMQDVVDDLPQKDMAWAVSHLPVMSAKNVQHVSEILAAVAAQVSGVTRQQLKNLIYEQDKMLKEIYVAKDHYDKMDTKSAEMLLKFEKDIQNAVLRGEKAGAMDMLNEMLAHIYVYSNFDISAIKARLLELLVILSRATIEAGADTTETFHLSENYIIQIESFSDSDQLAFWISGIIRRFIVQAFDLAQVKHSDVVFKISNYIKKNCSEKLTLDSLAKEVFLSKSYLSSIFKQETGMSLTAYITKVRIEKSKKMLLENNMSLAVIAGQCGFKDQSYFTKVFKKGTGVSPKKYRTSFYTDSSAVDDFDDEDEE